MKNKFAPLGLIATAALALTACSTSEGFGLKLPQAKDTSMQRKLIGSDAETRNDIWFEQGQTELTKRLAQQPITGRAKNVILFIADGMDPTTVTAARIYDGQSKGMSGEEHALAFETLPWLAMSKTYTTNAQVADSAGTATAMMTGIKTKSGTIGVSDRANVSDCESGLAAQVTTLGEWSEKAGMATGIISTARLTHATPATMYAHSASRNWENDTDLPNDSNCKDIASQLIDMSVGDGLEIALGGGRRNFLPKTVNDPEYKDKTGSRKDGRNLVAEWEVKSDAHEFVWNAREFLSAAPTTKLLGLFEPSHMQYEGDRAEDAGGEPSLAEMTRKAITHLSQDEDGFVLMVEGGRVDHAHHGGNAARALIDVQAFDAAVAIAKTMTDSNDTLIIVTADHGHTMAIQGYPQKGNPILGVVKSPTDDGSPSETVLPAGDGKPYTTLSYANGSGSILIGKKEGEAVERPFVDNETAQELNYKQQALIPSYSETHGGQDVQIFASGPQAHLFSGTVEQNYIFHVIDYALQLRARAGE